MLKILIKGELMRLIRYKILHISAAVTLIWVAIAALLSGAEAAEFAPMLIFVDSGTMSVMLLGAMIYFEKQEGTLKTTFITPVKIWQILFAKIFSAVLLGLMSSLLISLTVIIVHGVAVQILLLLLYTVLIVGASCALGFVFIFMSKDFNALLVNYMMFFLVMITLSVLFMLNVLPASIADLQLISPLYVAYSLIASTFGDVQIHTVIISILYNIVLSAVLFRYYIGKKLKSFSIGG